MSDLRECPCCFGILDVPASYKLSSACRCGFPETVTWSEFPARDVPYSRVSFDVDPETGRERFAA